MKKLLLLLLPLLLALNVFAQGSVSDVLELTNKAQSLYDQKQYKKALVEINNAISILEALDMDTPSRVLKLKTDIQKELSQQKPSSSTSSTPLQDSQTDTNTSTKTSTVTDSAEIIIDNYLEAIGGKTAWQNLYGLKRKWNTQVDEILVKGEMTQLTNGNYFLTTDTKSGGFEFKYTFAFDGNKSWYRMSTNDKIEYSDENEQKNAKIRAKDGLNPLVDYKQKGTKVTYIGQETFNGQVCYKLKVVKDSLYSQEKRIANATYIWINKYTNLLVGEEYQMTTDDDVYTYTYSDYRWVGNVKIPFKTSSDLNEIEVIYSEITLLRPTDVHLNFSPH